MRIIFAGTPAVAVPALEALHASPLHDVVAVLTRADARSGRGRSLEASPVKKRAQELGIPVSTAKPVGDEFLAWLRETGAEGAAVVAYGEILRQETLDALDFGWINLHFSVLPSWRGAAPVQRAIIAGDEFTGASTFVIEADLDSGPVIGVTTQRIGPRMTAGELLEVLGESGSQLLVATFDAIADGKASPVRQSRDGVSYAAKLSVAQGEVPWTAPAQHIDRLIRGFTPDPGAWTSYEGVRLGIGPVEPTSPDEPALQGDDLAPGEMLVTKKAVFVGTGSAPVRLSDVQPQGKKFMPAADWARGARPSAGATLGTASGPQEQPELGEQ
ncbi:methionyl-tRNA formyltransferase [Rarobacter faecitabidus]|uniref:Methionyl-tRNA formyltransferase n=1 Tax=Rarobacter faecitabidus TaxID=13243 RepID=A0A542ZVJ1_RARFA|nr:methionyl-tRNA formyltransferase [Rarobacter faecitabidus]TQL64377.1 methionyl-tRNA formyltransferase [Rarobacter faecitabidus]